MNSVCLIGRITKEPELKYTPNNIAYVMFVIAIDRIYKDKDGNNQTDFIPCIAWSNKAEFIGKYVKKGNLLEITGNIQSRSYQNSSGENRVIIEVVLDNVSNLTPKPKEVIPAPQEPSNFNPNFSFNNNDLPF